MIPAQYRFLTVLLLSLMGGLMAGLMWALPLAAEPLSEAKAQEAGQFIQELGDGVLQTLSNKNTDRVIAEQTFRDMLERSFDIPTISRFTLGQPWRKLNPAQRDEYSRLFKELCVRVYTERFALYTGEDFRVSNTRVADDRDVVVSSLIQRPNGQAVKTDWRVRLQADGSWRIVDVIVEGISMVITQRSEFASVMQRQGGSVEPMFDLLRQKIGQRQKASDLAASDSRAPANVPLAMPDNPAAPAAAPAAP